MFLVQNPFKTLFLGICDKTKDHGLVISRGEHLEAVGECSRVSVSGAMSITGGGTAVHSSNERHNPEIPSMYITAARYTVDNHHGTGGGSNRVLTIVARYTADNQYQYDRTGKH